MRQIAFTIQEISKIDENQLLLVEYSHGFSLEKASEIDLELEPISYSIVKKMSDRTLLEVLSDLIQEYQENKEKYSNRVIQELRADVSTITSRIMNEEISDIGKEKDQSVYLHSKKFIEIKNLEFLIQEEKAKAYDRIRKESIEKGMSQNQANQYADKMYRSDEQYMALVKQMDTLEKEKLELEKNQNEWTSLYWSYRKQMDFALNVCMTMTERNNAEVNFKTTEK